MALETTWEQATSYSAQTDRINIEAMHRYPGILGAASLKVTPNGGMSIAISTGRAIVMGTAQSNQGNYVIRNTAAVNVTHNPAPGSNSRQDRVVLRVYDNAADSSGQNTAAIEIIAGTPSATPSPPAAPNSTITLAIVVIPAGKVSILTTDILDQRNMTGIPTGMLMPWIASLGVPLPAGWVYANGTTLVRATWPDLFEICGTRFNTGGEAGTDFRLPKLNGRMVIGMDDMLTGPANVVVNAQADIAGGIAGAETVALGTSDLAPHSHPTTDHQHLGVSGQAFVMQNLGSAGQSVGVVSAQYTAGNFLTTGNVNGGPPATQNTGSGTPHNNMPPYIAFPFLIKA